MLKGSPPYITISLKHTSDEMHKIIKIMNGG